MARRAAAPGSDAAGFTFIELMIVLAILAFAFTYAIIHLDGATGGARLSSAGRQVGAAVEFLRGHAVQSRRTLELHLDLDKQEWSYVIPPQPTESEEERRDQEEVIFLEAAPLPRNIRFEAVQLDAHEMVKDGVVIVSFSARGEVSPHGFMVRLLSDEIADAEEASFSVEVNGLTGEVTYVPGYAAFDQVVAGESF